MADWQIEPNGLAVHAPLTYDVWRDCLTVITGTKNASEWALGDALVYGETYFPERYAQALDHTRYTYGSIRNLTYVARRFPPSARVYDLSRSHYTVAAPLPDSHALPLLAQAVSQALTRDELRDEKRRISRACPLCNRPMLRDAANTCWACTNALCEHTLYAYPMPPLTASDADPGDLDAHAVERIYGVDAAGDWLPIARRDRRTIERAETDFLGVIEIYGLKRYTKYRVVLEEVA